MEEVEAKFAPNMHAVDWATIRSTAPAQVAESEVKQTRRRRRMLRA
jgi:hypothetical protein